MSDLLPCPWCGSPARLLGRPETRGFDTEDANAVICNNDQCQATGPFLASTEQATEAWNRMANLQAERDEAVRQTRRAVWRLRQARDEAVRLLSIVKDEAESNHDCAVSRGTLDQIDAFVVRIGGGKS